MADIAHALPASVLALEASVFGIEYPIDPSPITTGPQLARTWGDFGRRTYELRPQSFDPATLTEFETFLHHVAGGFCFIPETRSDTHYNAPCGALADGVRTTFRVPVIAPTGTVVYADGVAVNPADYTLHAAANLVAEAAAECSNAALTNPSNGTDADSTIARHGSSSIEVTPAGSSKPALRPTTAVSGPAVGEIYTAVVGILATASSAQNYRSQVGWYTDGSAWISNTNQADVSVAAGAWRVLSVTGTAPATTGKANSQIQRNDASGTDLFYVGAFALCPGDYTTWHLPSQAPGLIEFDTAPAAGVRVSITTSGKYLARCRLDAKSMQWAYNDDDRAQVRVVRAVECLEF